MLWDQTKQLPKETFNQIEQMYLESGFPMEVRLNLADFVESKFLPNAEIDDTTAANLANQLLSQLDAKIAATPNDADKFLHKKNLQELSDTLKVSKPFYYTFLWKFRESNAMFFLRISWKQRLL